MTQDGKILKGLFEHKRLELVNESGECSKFNAIKANCEYRFKISLECNSQLSYHLKTPNI